MSSSIQSDCLTDTVAAPALATHQSGTGHYVAMKQPWDPYEVWLNRVHRPRAEQGVRDTPKAQAPAVRDVGGAGMNPSSLTVVQTIAR